MDLFVIVLLVMALATILCAAPTPTARVTPDGYHLYDGFVTKMTFSLDPNIALWEIEGHHSGVDNGQPIDISTMWNNRFVTTHPQPLIKHTPASFKFAYDPKVKDELDAICGIPGIITVTFPDGSTDAEFGYLQKVEFDKLVRGSFATGTATIEFTDYDTTDRTEAAPVRTLVTGTAG